MLLYHKFVLHQLSDQLGNRGPKTIIRAVDKNDIMLITLWTKFLIWLNDYHQSLVPIMSESPKKSIGSNEM